MTYSYIRFGDLPYHLDTPMESVYVDSIVKAVENDNSGNIVFTAIIERLPNYDRVHRAINIVESIAQRLNKKAYFLLHDTAIALNLNKENVHYINTWALVTYKHSVTRYRKRWYPESNKALFLVGKPFKLQRIGLLYEFHKKNSLNYLTYTLHCLSTQENRSKIAEMNINGLSDDREIHNLLSELHQPESDIDLAKRITHTGFEYTGFPTNLRYYRNTSLSIISENSFEQTIATPYLTEKLYRAIVNHHPFIVLGDSGVHEYIESLGYRTYNKYFLPLTASIKRDNNKLVSWVVDSVKYFMDNKDRHIDDIDETTRHNFKIFMARSSTELELLKTKVPNIDLNDRELFGPL